MICKVKLNLYELQKLGKILEYLYNSRIERVLNKPNSSSDFDYEKLILENNSSDSEIDGMNKLMFLMDKVNKVNQMHLSSFNNDYKISLNLLNAKKKLFVAHANNIDELIRRWNNKVSENDIVYVLGDLIYKSNNNSPEYYLDKLNGKKILIKGNHDGTWLKKIDVNKYFDSVYDYLEISDEGRWVVLFHYPLLEWNAKFRGSYHLHGHTHNNIESEALRYSNEEPKMYNVSCDAINFEPKTLDELMELYKK